jgi:predicted acetyltransferase
MSREDHERLMCEARAVSAAARVALWRAIATARQIEKLVASKSQAASTPA